MPVYQSFAYDDPLTERGRERLPEILCIDGDRVPEVLLILRALSGSLNITHNYTGETVKCRENYFVSDFKSFGQKWRTKFPKVISEDLSADDLAIYIESTKYTNKQFYRNILSEISQFCLLNARNSHTSSFIFVYRLLEKISYAFPLIYAARSHDFVRSFGQLKDLMSGGGEKKELGFFKKFVKELYKDDAISETSVDINITANSEDVQKQIFKEMRRVCEDEIIHEDTAEPRKLSINYCDMGSFIVTIRNRFFHNSNGGESNIESWKIVDSDLFFNMLNPLAMQWISRILIEILSHNMSEFQSFRRIAID